MNGISKLLIHPGKRISTQITVLILAWIAFVPQLRAQTLLTESFNYPAGTLLTGAQWTQIAAGTPTASVSAGNLIMANSIGNGIGNKVALSNTGQDVYKTFTSTTLNATVPAIYAHAVVNVSAAQATGDYFLSLGSATTSIARVYIRSNGAGFSFGILRNTGTVEYESVERPFNTNIRLVLKYEQVTGTTNDIVKLYINPSVGSEPAVADISHTGTAADTGSFAAIQLYQGSTAVTTNAPTLEIDNLVVNTIWAGVTSAVYDYGDVPASYDNTKDGVFAPAGHSLLSGLYLGSIAPDLDYMPANVALDADNNGANGDGTDEDAITPSSNPIKKGIAYTLSIPVNNPATATRYLYGWIDLNNDGKFQIGEVATTSFSTAGSSIQTLTWTIAQTSTIVSSATKLYMRIRLSTSSLIDATDATIDERSVGNGAISTVNALDAATTSVGEVEDYNIPVSTSFDYGDVPASYENDINGNPLPALHLPLTGLSIGTLIDMEAAPFSVAAGADNNGINGDGTDEDGISSLTSITKGTPYSITIPVNNPAVVTRYLYGWIDFNNDGKFQTEELADAIVSFSTSGTSTQTLTWSATKTATIASGSAKLYMRLRLSTTSLTDFTSGTGFATLDERSIGNGASFSNSATNLPAVATGEVEDYQLIVTNTFEYGDVPASFENDINGNPLPATHAVLAGFTIGKLIDAEAAPASVNAPNENNTTGDNLVGIADEDGISTFTSVSRGVAYSIQIPVNVPATLTGATYLYGWLDLNGDGRFQSGEVATTTNTITGENYLTLTWTAAQTTGITAGISKIYLRLRYSNMQLTDFISGTGFATIDERSVGNGATTTANAVNNPLVSFGEVEDYQLPVDQYDFGDVPVSYDTNNASALQPARQISTTEYTIGTATDFEATAQSVTLGNDNNGTNGDGADEDGITGALPVVTKGASFNFSVPVNTSIASNIIAWVDFNNNGKFEASEAAYTTSAGAATGYQATPVGTSVVTFWFRGAQTGLIPSGVTNLYSRIRLTATAGADAAATGAIDERSIADGASTGIYTTPSFGEVEDYRFSVGTEVYDFGDAPISYEMDKDGTANPANFKPARNNPNDLLYLGISYDKEAATASVAVGADNNGTNGDGNDENGLATGQLFIQSAVINNYVIVLNNNSGAAATLYGWIDFNGNGRFEATEATTVSVPDAATSATLSFTAAQISSIPTTTAKLYMRLRLIQPETGVTIADLTTGTNNLIVDERAIADGLSTGVYATVSNGEVEDYQLTIIRDFGDVPSTYENGSPASQSNTIVPEVTLGATIDYELTNTPVASGADNNGTNGDGADEDAITTTETITSGTPFTLKLPVNSTLSGTKNLYGWIDFNGDGIFNGSEFTSTTVFVTAGTTATATLTWANTTATTGVLLAGKTYARFRLSTAALAANGNNATPTLIDTRSYGPGTSTGEIEDYQFLVTNNYDYGDAPISYDMNKDGTVNPLNYLPARQVISPLLTLGATVDIESSAQHVTSGANNNGANGDGNDEDGTTAMPINRNTAYYSKVSVMNNTGVAKNLYGWIDLNNDGRFQVGELATTTPSVPSSPTQQTFYLSWTAAETNTILAGVNNVYMRLRISNGTLADLGSGLNNAVVDERAIGDGLAGNAASTPYGVAQIGEIEDYLLPVTSAYDFGDAPDTYDTSRNAIIAPARQAISSALHLGDLAADQESAKLTSTNATGDDNNNTDDEDGTIPGVIYTGGGNGYSLRVKATNNTGAARTLYGWIDFNNDGRFQTGESTTISVPNATNNGLVTLTWAAANTVITGTPSQLMMRLRISEAATLTDFTTGVPGGLVDEGALADGLNTGEYAAAAVIFNGEVEDYTIPVSNQLDYGDVPAYYEANFISVSVPARHLPNGDLYIGNTVDIESTPQSVAAGANNNAPNGDGNDEDGIATLPTLVTGAGYPVWVNVTNNQAVAATLHGWIDLDGNGVFTSGEYASVAVPANSGSQQVLLNWPLVAYNGTAGNTYMRLRLSSAAFTDNAATPVVDERSIGDGLTTGAYGSYPINGEVEDYYVPVFNDVATPQDCNINNPLGLVNPIQAVWHTSLIKLATGDWTIFGAFAAPNYGSQITPNLITPEYGFNYKGKALMATMASDQFFILTTAGLYSWGSPIIFGGAVGFKQVPLPLGVAPGNIQMIDGGHGSVSLALLTKTGEVWMRTNTIGIDVQGNGKTLVDDWVQVMLNNSTPLTGIKDVRTSGTSAFATDGNNFYTWGTGTYLGNGSSSSTRSYATKMSTATGITLPVKQIDVSNSGGTSYYALDSAGKVFVLGSNGNGQLGLGHSTNQTRWSVITKMNEEPDATGNQTDITKPIGKVRWITANNQDMFDASIFGLITEEDKAYMAAITVYNVGDKTGVQGATNRAIPTAVTAGSGSTMLPGKVHLLEAGGHISVIAMKGSDRYGYAGHTADGSDGCNSCTGNPTEFKLQGPPSIGPICGNTAFDYGDLDERYNPGDMAKHEIKFAQSANPVKLGTVAPDSDNGPQFTVSGSGNDALGDDNDGDTDTTGSSLDDEDAFTGTMPVKTAGTPYTLNVPLTNNSGSTAYLYGFIDWNSNGSFEANEAVIQTVPSSSTAQTVTLTWADPGNIANCTAGVSIRSFIRLRLTTSNLTDVTSTTIDERSHLAAGDGEVEDYYVDWMPNCAETYCYKPAAVAGTTLETKHGITALGRAGVDNSNWPMERKGAWTVLESKEKGFVVNRVPTTASLSLIINPVEGMMVYDQQAACLKIYTIKEGETTANWHCFTTQACPD